MSPVTVNVVHCCLLVLGSSLATFGATVVFLNVLERLTSRRRLRQIPWDGEIKHIHKTFAPSAVSPRRLQKARQRKSATSPSVRPITVRAQLERHEWKGRPVQTLSPKADWN